MTSGFSKQERCELATDDGLHHQLVLLPVLLVELEMLHHKTWLVAKVNNVTRVNNVLIFQHSVVKLWLALLF